MIKIKKTILLIFLFIIFTSCNSQNKKTGNEEFKGYEKMRIEFNFYPSSGGEAIYRVNYAEDTVLIKNLKPRENDNTIYKKVLSDKKVKRLKKAVSELRPRNNVETDIILDSWRIELVVNGIVRYNESDVNLQTLPNDINTILSLLIDGSTVEIELYGFSWRTWKNI